MMTIKFVSGVRKDERGMYSCSIWINPTHTTVRTNEEKEEAERRLCVYLVDISEWEVDVNFDLLDYLRYELFNGLINITEIRKFVSDVVYHMEFAVEQDGHKGLEFLFTWKEK